MSHWAGVPAIGEPDKCTELVWANSAAVPADTIGYIRAALDAVAPGTPPLLSYGWDVSVRQTDESAGYLRSSL